MAGFVYMMSNAPRGVIYTGVTADLWRRAGEHRNGGIDGFTKKQGCKSLVWFERHDDIRSAIQREKSLKRYRRDWKIRLIEGFNPTWLDLFDQLGTLDNPFKPTFAKQFDEPSQTLGTVPKGDAL